ncbi:uncharacterized protein RCC_02569 [Ramularia collo-cygni]|uniref:Uncharacterized protein n=1 Tax=Ramularia collo-cygni TaxID=112498 RepID=A0A2D3V2L8_9PEZI|nr:uncharacterized protein RCC_02569 [Ramularia collo-cygni]CZT16734.1 uncharacterized protein RCC_02569 [Ramularia collo-cygni]
MDQPSPRLGEDTDSEEDSVQAPPAKKVRKVMPSKKSPKHFRLMDLAPELRNVVYKMVLEDHPVAKLSRNSSLRVLSSTSVLPRVSKQVRDEFLGVLITSVPVIETSVVGFSFGHVITFLNRRSDIELQRMTSVNASQTLRISLQFPPATLNVTELQRWLNRSVHPTKKGAKIDFQYINVRQYLPHAIFATKLLGSAEAAKIRNTVR